MKSKRPSFQTSIFDTAKQDDSPAGSTYLFLTYNRSIQQANKKIQLTKQNLRGKKFKIRKNKPKFCRNHKIALLKITNKSITEAKFKRIPCNSWTCPECSIKKALIIKYYFREVIEMNKLKYFLTLTLDPKKIPNEYKNNTHRYITKIFNHFLTILRRNKEVKNQSTLKYVWVIEYQKNGNAHMHILLNNFLNINTVRKDWEYVGGGAQMRIVLVESLKGISNYISDYIVKGIKGEFEEKSYGFKYFERRYSISKSCERPQKNVYKKLTIVEEITDLKDIEFSWVHDTLNTFEEDIVIKK